MKFLRLGQLVLLGISAGQVRSLSTNSSSMPQLQKRATVDEMVAGLPYGVLMNGDTQSVCGVVPANSEYAFVAASCLDKPNGSQVGTYKATFFSPGASSPITVTVIKAEAHPNYDSETFANNIAYIQFAKTELTSAVVGDWPIEWPSTALVHTTLTADNSAWNSPLITTAGAISVDSKCSKASTLYSQDSGDIMCNSATHSSLYNSDCVLPFKIAMGYDDQGAAPLGLYSYSAVSEKDGLCSSGTATSYYILFKNYIPWLESATGSIVMRLNRRPDGYAVTNKADYTVTSPATSENDGEVIISLKKAGEVVVGSDGEGGNAGETTSSTSTTTSSTSSITRANDDNENSNNDPEAEVTTKTVTRTVTEPGDDADPITIISTEVETEIITVSEINTETATEMITDATTSTTVQTSTETITTTELITTTEIVTTSVPITMTESITNTASSFITSLQSITSTLPITEVSSVTETVTLTETVTESIDATPGGESVEPEILTVTETVSEVCSLQDISLPIIESITEEITVTDTVSGEVVLSTITVANNESYTTTLVMTLIEYVPTTVTFTAIPSDDGEPSSTEPTPEPSSNSQDEYSSDSETNGNDDGSDEVIPGLPLSWPALIAILVIVLIILIVLGYLFYRWRKKRQAEDGAPAYFTDRQPSYVSQRSYRGYSGYSGNSNYGPGAGYTGIAGNIAKNGYGRGVDDPRFTMNTNNSRYKVSPRYTDNMYSNNPKSARHKTNATGTTSRSYWPTPARNTTWSMNTSQISDFGANQRNEYSKYDDYFGDNQNGYDSPHQSTRGWFGKTFGKLFGR